MRDVEFIEAALIGHNIIGNNMQEKRAYSSIKTRSADEIHGKRIGKSKLLIVHFGFTEDIRL